MTHFVEHIFTIDDLKYLIKSGRINKASAILGNMLHVKPILHVEDGEIKLFQKVRGKRKALNQIVDIVEDRMSMFPNQMVAIMHADDLEVATELESLLKNRLGDFPVMIDKIGSALGTHLGIGGVGVFFFNQKPSIFIE